MSIIEIITDDNRFWHWVDLMKQADSSYGNCFTKQAAMGIQSYYEELSENTGENVEFDPIAWCVEFTEYDNLHAAYVAYTTGDDKPSKDEMIEYLQDSGTVIELDNGHVVLGGF